MKYAVIIPDGAADVALDALGGSTPLATAKTPHMDWIAANGRCGTVRNIPKSLAPGSDVAILSLLGYDPLKCYTGRAPLEAAGQGLVVPADEWIFRCNLVTVVNGVMEDFSAGHISTEEAGTLIAELNRILGGPHVKFHPGISYRHLMTYKGEVNLKTTPPHDISSKNISNYLPTGKGAETIRTLIERSMDILPNHDINAVRADLGENPASAIWLWGQGKMPHLETFEHLHSIKGAAITAVDLIRGISKLIGWDVIDVPGATGYLDTDYRAKGAYAVEAIDKYDIVCVHVEAPDEAGHNADIAGKIEAIEQIDRHIVKPVLEKLQSLDDWRILVLPDHPTPCTIRTHTRQSVPFAMAGAGVIKVISAAFNEQAAQKADLHVERGCDLMEYFLTVR